MNRMRAIAVPIASLPLSLGALGLAPAAVADDAPSDPCARQQAQLDRASAKYDALQAKFAAHPTKKVKKAKKAQAQRVAHAQARLDNCTAESSESSEG